MITKINGTIVVKNSYVLKKNQQKSPAFNGKAYFSCSNPEKNPNFFLSCEYFTNWLRMCVDTGIRGFKNKKTFVMKYPEKFNDMVESSLAGTPAEKIFNTEGMKIKFAREPKIALK